MLGNEFRGGNGSKTLQFPSLEHSQLHSGRNSKVGIELKPSRLDAK